MSVEYVFFDLDETLFDFHAAEHRAISLTLAHFGVTPDDERCALYSACNLRQWKRLERGETTRERIKTDRFSDFFEKLGLAVAPTEAAAFYEEKLSQGCIFLPYAETLLKELYGRYKLYIVTNGLARVQKGRLADSGIEPYFENIFISELVGADKPNRAFFEACFAKIPHFDREKAVLVGDSLTSDICGGNRAGLFTVWFNAQKTPFPTEKEQIPDRVITQLSELPPLLTSLSTI